MNTEVVYTLIYALFAVCAVFPPTEFVSSGLTIQCLFSSYVGSEDLRFSLYHIRRTTLYVIIHANLPLGYFLGLWYVAPEYYNLNDSHLPVLLTLGGYASCAISVVVVSLAILWSRQNFKNHPIAKTMSLYADGRPWQTVASDLDVEFRRVDKYASSANALSRVIVTDSWIIKVGPYFVNLVHQSDVNLSMVSSEEHQLSHTGNTGGVQVLTIRVDTTRREIASFNIRLNSLEYNDFKEKLRAPVRNARSIVIHQTLSDRFVEAFKSQVLQNQRYHQPPGASDPEPCIGCMQNTSNIKLQKCCDAAEAGNCLNCYCRPMWCISCMGKWFASRQDQTQPDTWMQSKSPCPTCRATFCVLDVCLLVPV